MITHLYHKIKFAILKRKIKKNLYLGKENIDGTYDCKAVKSQREEVRYIFNPFRWLFSFDAGMLRRRGVWAYQYTTTHHIVYNSRGGVWVNKEGRWLHGKIYGKEVKWDTTQK